ncbi:MAG: cupin domain-containing protein [Ramlibacter sp.]|nr:cupin domain-containing protein [Ramlibacter sp.]
MKKATLIQSLIGLVVFGLGLTTGLFAQPTSGSPPSVEQKRNDLSGAPGMEVISTVVEFKIGETIDLHSHHGIETIYVIQGASVQVPGKDPRTLPTGATLVNLRDVKHGGFKVVGDTSLKLFTVHVVDQGKPLYDYSK